MTHEWRVRIAEKLRAGLIFPSLPARIRHTVWNMRKPNRFESAYPVKHTRDFLGVGPAWWGAVIVATGCFAFAITWMLTSTAA